MGGRPRGDHFSSFRDKVSLQRREGCSVSVKWPYWLNLVRTDFIDSRCQWVLFSALFHCEENISKGTCQPECRAGQ